jgi:hypothetical protein
MPRGGKRPGAGRPRKAKLASLSEQFDSKLVDYCERLEGGDITPEQAAAAARGIGASFGSLKAAARQIGNQAINTYRSLLANCVWAERTSGFLAIGSPPVKMTGREAFEGYWHRLEREYLRAETNMRSTLARQDDPNSDFARGLRAMLADYEKTRRDFDPAGELARAVKAAEEAERGQAKPERPKANGSDHIAKALQLGPSKGSPISPVEKWRLTACAWSDRNLSPYDKVVYGALISFHHNTSGKCNPSLTSLMLATGLTRPSVIAGLRALRAAGYISYADGTRGRHRKSSYVIKVNLLYLLWGEDGGDLIQKKVNPTTRKGKRRLPPSKLARELGSGDTSRLPDGRAPCAGNQNQKPDPEKPPLEQREKQIAEMWRGFQKERKH